jgi:hypothetical protein
MKTKFLAVLVIGACLMTFPARVVAAPDDSGMAMIADAVIARPLCLAATAIGSVFFVLTLPVAAITKDVDRTSHALVVTPAKATFTRPLGDFESMKEY